jgi:lipopolysaccharide export system permease protein
MHHVFIQNRSGGKLGVISAKYGELKNLTGGLYLVLEDGERVQGFPGELDAIIEKFDQYAVRIDKRTIVLPRHREGVPSSELWASNELSDIAEIQTRFSIPMGVIFLSFLAVPLAKLSPRGGVYGSLLVAFAIYFVYGNLKRVSHSLVANETMPVAFGYVGVYAVLFLLGSALLVRLYGVKWVVMKIKSRGET